MNAIYILTTVIFTANTLHAGVLAKIFSPLLCSWLFPDSNWKENERFNPSTDRFKLMLSITFFSAILLLYYAYKNAQIKSLTIHYILLIILIILSVFFIYFNKYKIWSKSNRIVPSKKNKTDLTLNGIQETLNNHANTINQNSETINSIENNYTRTNREFENKILTINDTTKKNHELLTKTKKVKVDIENLKNEITTINNKHLRTKESFKIETTEIYRNTKEIKNDIEQIKKTVINKKKSVTEKENRKYESYFKSKKLFQDTEIILKENNFYTNKNNLKAVRLSILTYKLQKLKIININRYNKYYCMAAEKQFGIEKLDPGMLSDILNSLEDGSAIPKHNKILKGFAYLDKLV